MLNLINISKPQSSHQILLPNYKPFTLGGGNACFAVIPKFKSVRKLENVCVGRANRMIKAVQTSIEKSTTSTTTSSVAVEITMWKTLGGVLHQVGLVKEGLDYLVDCFGLTLHVELVAAEFDPHKYIYIPLN
ncbi:Lipoxygenase [Abeliophyllum distichum]|uniref:Lipoxygenase n=1 Tax=Abeliophyllum distichum TaxID=126358 RepID=A0ABD1Q2T1_9LAMI